MEKQLILESDLSKIVKVENYVDCILEDHQINEELYGNILISVLEAVNNAIVHGNRLNPEKKVVIKSSITENDLKITIKDDGEGFDYKNVPDPTSPENIEKINGRGIFLIKNLSDKVEFINNGQIIEITFKFN